MGLLWERRHATMGLLCALRHTTMVTFATRYYENLESAESAGDDVVPLAVLFELRAQTAN